MAQQEVTPVGVPKEAIPAASSTGRADSGSASPCTELEVSQVIATLQPFAFSLSRCGWIVRFSTSTGLTSRLSECQPETNLSPYDPSSAFSA